MLDIVEGWSGDWQMPLQSKKCKVMHVGRDNPGFTYKISGHTLESVGSEKDLGITLSQDLKVSDQCVQAYSRANRIL